MATDIPCSSTVSPVQAAVCMLIKEILAAHEARRRDRRHDAGAIPRDRSSRESKEKRCTQENEVSCSGNRCIH